VARLVDLHAHTTVSDGTLSPAELVRLAAQRGLVALAVTDHDHVGGLAEAAREGARLNVEIVPGIELSVTDPEAGELHLLGYLFDPAHAPLLARLDALREGRLARGARIVAALRAHGVEITLDEVLQGASGALGRPHVARVLVEKGRAASVQDAFDRWLADGRPAFVPKEKLSPQEGLALVHDAGGVCSLAHAVTVPAAKRGALVRKLAKLGLDAVEVQHSKHGEAERREMQALADELGLAVSGGSDYHGANKPAVELGSVRVEESVLAALKTRAARRRSPNARGS